MVEQAQEADSQQAKVPKKLDTVLINRCTGGGFKFKYSAGRLTATGGLTGLTSAGGLTRTGAGLTSTG